ncbi:MAG: glycosyl hydrolase family 38, partial [Muribaculaceae bacterium]
MRKLIVTFFSLLAFMISHGQHATIYTQLPVDHIKVSASSELNSKSVFSVVNGAGMIGRKHNAHNLGHGMWVSKVSKKNVRYNESTHEGIVWFSCDFGKVVGDIDMIQIWNYNQAEHTRRGLKKVYIEYSSDGISWTILRNKDKDYHIFPESIGRNPEGVSYVLDSSGLKARYICFTAATDGDGNYYDRNNPVILQEASDMYQDINYYGLSEVKFFKKELMPISKVGAIKDFSLIAGQGYLKSNDGPKREYTLKFDSPLYVDAVITFNIGNKKWKEKILASPIGIEEYAGCFPAGYMDKMESMDIDVKTMQGNVNKTVEVPGARKWIVNFFPHSHLDIGYTHRQDDVMKLQWRNIERALDLADRTKNYPDGSKFKWNSEATWAISEYIEKYRGTEKGDRIKKAVQDGILNIDMGLGSILTGISRQEEIMHVFDDGHKISKEFNVELNTAMMSDVPGQVWGFATSMAKNGVKYYSGAPNYVPFYGKIGNDRAAALHTKWGDRPFYWQSQSGTDKVLVWQAGRGYSWFHGWLANRIGVCGIEPIWSYLSELEEGRFPYDRCYLRYTVHGDNGPPDESMPDVIRAWNEKYESPK